MLTLQGTVYNVLRTPGGTDRDGNEYQGRDQVQLLIERPMRNGQSRADFVNLTVSDPEPFRAFQDREVLVPVGAYPSGNTVGFFHLANAEKPVYPARNPPSSSAS